LVLLVAVVFAACSPTPGPPETTGTTLTAPVTVSTTTSTPIDWVAYVEDAVDFMEANHFQADEKDWEAIRAEALRLVVTNPSYANAKTGLQNAAYQAGNSYFSPVELIEAETAPETLLPTAPPEGRRLAGDIGYLILPGGWEESETLETYATDVRRIVEFIDADPVCGWVIDLRESLHPVGFGHMLAAVNPLLGDGTVVHIRSPGDDQWSIEGGVVVRNGTPEEAQAGPGYAVHDPTAPVALLMSADTSYPGAWLVHAFQGRPGVRSFGEPTGLLWMGHATLDLPDGSRLAVGTGRPYDVLRQTEISHIDPDVRILQVPTERGDVILDAATTWLQETAGCQPTATDDGDAA
jgi:hypothetical protein